MADYVWTAFKESADGLTLTELDNIQNVTFALGRQQIQDPFKAGTATITGRVPSGLPTLEIDDKVHIRVTDGTFDDIIYFGKVANFAIDYGFTTNLDRWVLNLEDGIAKAGRALTSDSFSWSAGIRTDVAASQACTNCGITLVNIFTTLSYTSQGQSFVSAQTLANTNLLNILNELAFTEQGRITQNGYDQIGWVNRSDLGQTSFVCSITDGSLTANYDVVPFDSVQFTSLADSFFDAVVVEPVGLASQLSGTGDRVFSHRSFDQTTTQADNLADYVKATLDVQTAKPFQVSMVSNVQTTDGLLLALQLFSYYNKAELILRGSRYNVFLNGVTVTADPDRTRVSFSVVSSDAQNFFILDSPTFGVLDTNKLGF